MVYLTVNKDTTMWVWGSEPKRNVITGCWEATEYDNEGGRMISEITTMIYIYDVINKTITWDDDPYEYELTAHSSYGDEEDMLEW